MSDAIGDPMSHEAARELLAMAALDALSPAERPALDAHLATCADCKRDLAQLRDGAATLGMSLPQQPMTLEHETAMRARLLARAAAEHSGVVPISAAPSRAPLSSKPASRALIPPAAWRWIAIAATIVALVFYRKDVQDRETGMAIVGDVRTYLTTEVALRKELADQKALVAELTGRGVRVIDAAATGAAKPYGRMFWDQPAGRWTFVAHDLPAPEPGHTYQLWMITRDSRKLSAGTFVPTANGSALVRTTYALASDSLAAIAVTNEPAGGSAQPTTTPFLVGAAKTD